MTKFEDNISPYLSFVEGSAPSSPAATNFKLYYDSSDHLLKWKNSAGTVTSLATNPMTTAGDTIYGGASGVPTRLAGGTSTYVLTSNGATSAPSWQAPGGGGGVTFAYGGYNTIGASQEAITALRIYMKKITLANDCMLGALELYLDHTSDSVAGTPVIGLWSDNSGVPLTLSYQEGTVATDTLYLASSTSSWPARWIGIGSYSKWLTAGDYWVGWMFADVGSLRLYYDAGADRYMTSGNNWLANGDRYSQTDSTRKYSARVTTIR